METSSSSIFQKIQIISNSLAVEQEAFDRIGTDLNTDDSLISNQLPQSFLENNSFMNISEEPDNDTTNSRKLKSSSSISPLDGYSKTQELKLVSIGLASSDKIIEWAEKILPNGKIFGEVLNANTLHYKTFKPHKGGLFCERIFGPLKDFECACGIKQKPFDDENSILNLLNINKSPRKFCPNCDVEYTWSVVRRYQMGYIQLVSPVTHLWYLKTNPSYLSLLLDIRKKDLEAIIYCMQTTTLEYYWRPIHSLQMNLTPSSLFASYKEFLKLDKEILEKKKNKSLIKLKQKQIEVNKRKNFHVTTQNIITNPMEYINNLKKDSLEKQILFLEKSFQLSSDSATLKKINKKYYTLNFLNQKNVNEMKKKYFFQIYDIVITNFYKNIYFRLIKRVFVTRTLEKKLKASDFPLKNKSLKKITLETTKFSSSLNLVLKNELLKKSGKKQTKKNNLNLSFTPQNEFKLSQKLKNSQVFRYQRNPYFQILRNVQLHNGWKEIYQRHLNSNYFIFHFELIPFLKNFSKIRIKKSSLAIVNFNFHEIMKPTFLFFVLPKLKNKPDFTLKKYSEYFYSFKAIKTLTKNLRLKKKFQNLLISQDNKSIDLELQYFDFAKAFEYFDEEFYQTEKQKIKNLRKINSFFQSKPKVRLVINIWLNSVVNLILSQKVFPKNFGGYFKESKKEYLFNLKNYFFENQVHNKDKFLIATLNKKLVINQNSSTRLFLYKLRKFYSIKSKKKILINQTNQKKGLQLFNNIYTVSFSFGWETEKDWRYFLYYNTAPIELQDEILNSYKYRLNSDFMVNKLLSPSVPIIGANLIQKLLIEYEGLELKNMSKQYQNILPKLNRYIRYLRQIANKKSDFLQIEKLLQKRDQIIRRLKLFRKLFRKNAIPTSMILNTLPVLPPDLRPILKMQNQIAASDLNRFYQRILYRNDRFKKFFKSNSSMMSSEPNFEMKYAQRLLQEAVDNLIQNGKGKVKPETNSRGQPLKSLSEILKGKQGRFRQYLLGKRVDYSGRSVIVVGPSLKIYECGLPFEMAMELFLPFLIKRIFHYQLARTVIGAKTILKHNQQLTWELLEEVMQNHPILLNRAPTLHRLGIQAFQPKLILGRAILLHPLVCPAFNADFDGDQMAVHVPITVEARTEAWKLMFSRNHLVSPATGEPMLLPSQDMVLGCYYLTKESLQHDRFFQNRPFSSGTGFYFSNLNEVLQAYSQQKIHLQTPIWIKWNGLIQTEQHFSQPIEIRLNPKGNWTELRPKIQKRLTFDGKLESVFLRTTAGRVLFNKMIQTCIQSH